MARRRQGEATRSNLEERLAKMASMYKAGESVAAQQFAVEESYSFTKAAQTDKIGVVVEGVNSTLGSASGWCTRVKSLVPGGLADMAGLYVGMAVLSINGTPVTSPLHAVELLREAVGTVAIAAAPPTESDRELWRKAQTRTAEDRKARALAEKKERERVEAELARAEQLARQRYEAELRREEARLSEARLEAARLRGEEDNDQATGNAAGGGPSSSSSAAAGGGGMSAAAAAQHQATLAEALEMLSQDPDDISPFGKDGRGKDASSRAPVWHVVPRDTDSSAAHGDAADTPLGTVRIALDDGSFVVVRLEALQDFAPEMVAAVSSASSDDGPEEGAAIALSVDDEPMPAPAATAAVSSMQASHDLALPGHSDACVRAIAAWLEGALDARKAEADFDGANEALLAARTPLADLSAVEVARLFSYHALRREALLLTCADASLAGGVLSGQAEGPAGPETAEPNMVTRTGEMEPVDGAGLDADAAAASLGIDAASLDEKVIDSRYAGAYRTDVLLMQLPVWHARGVPTQETLTPSERAKADAATGHLSVAVEASRAKLAAAAAAATADAPLATDTLKLAHALGLTPLVGAAVNTLAGPLSVETAADELVSAMEMRIAPLRDRVSGYIVAHIHSVSATASWKENVPTREKTRILALAAAARSNPLGLSQEGATDLPELVAYARETLREMEERLDVAKTDTAADEVAGAASAEHAWKMIDNQEHRVRVLRAFIASQEQALQVS